MFNFLFLTIFLSQYQSLLAQICFSPEIDDISKCYSCACTHYYNDSAIGFPFPSSECQAKEISSLTLQILVLSIGSQTVCEDCDSKSYTVQEGLFSALIFVSEKCRIYYFCEANLYLEATTGANPHIVINLKKIELEVFRRSNIKLTIQPLFCGILSSKVPCASGLDFLQTVLFKATDIKFFFSGSVIIRNIIWDFTDLAYNKKDDACWSMSKCCTDLKINNPGGDGCYLKDTIVTGNPASRTYGLFNLELILDNPVAPTPALTIDTCRFINLYVLGYGLGFTALIKSGGYSFFNISIVSTNFENVFFLEGIIATYSKPESFTVDPVYKTYSYDSLRKLVLANFANANTTQFYFKSISILNYNKFNVKDMTKGSNSDALLLQLGKTGFRNVYIENLLITNVTNQTQRQLYLMVCSSEKNDTTFILKSVIATDVLSSTFISLLATTESIISNISLSRWVQSANEALLNFQNLSLLRADDLYLDSVQSKIMRSPSLLFTNCLISQLTNLNLKKTVGLSIDVAKSTTVQLKKISFYDCQYKALLFYSDSIFNMSDVKIISVTPYDTTLSFIFSFRSILFNLSSIYINSISAEAIFDYRDAQSVFITGFIMEYVTGVRTIFYITVTFYATQLTDFTVQYCLLPRFAEFLNTANFATYTPAIKIMRARLINLTLPALNADVFAAFTKMDFVLRDSIFENVKRVDMGSVAPFGILFISRQGSSDIQNTSFFATGYSFVPRLMNAVYNFPLIFMSYILRSSVRYCIFESDETVSLNCGFLSTGAIPYFSEVTNSKFLVRKKNPNFIYKGVAMLHSLVINYINNSFSNLGCTPYHLYSHQLRSGPLIIHGEETMTFLKNTKKLEMHNNSFENCNCENGGSFHISNYHIINITNIFIQNSSAISGGGFCIISSSNVSIVNFTTLFTTAYEAGSLYYSTVLQLTKYNYKEVFSSGNNSGSWRIDNSVVFCYNLAILNTSSETNGGFSVLYSSSLQVYQGIIMNTSAKQYGGSIFAALSSKVILNNLIICGVFAQNGGFLSGNDALLVSMKNSTAENVQANLTGALIFFDLVFQSFIDNIKIKRGLSDVGIIYIKTFDEQSFHNISNLWCQENIVQQKIGGSCIFFRSSSGLLINGVTIEKCTGIPLAIRYDYPINFILKNIKAFNLEKVDYLLEIVGLSSDIVNLAVYNCTFNKYILFIKSSNVSIDEFFLSNNSRTDKVTLYSINTKSSNISIKYLIYQNFLHKMACLLNAETSNVLIYYSRISEGKGTSAVLSLDRSIFYAEKLIFENNLITCIATSLADLTLKDVEFINNYGTETNPSDINFINKVYSANSVLLNNVSSSTTNPGRLISFQNIESLIQSNCTFIVKKIDAESEEIIQGILLKDINEITLKNNSFYGFTSTTGSAAIMIASNGFKSSIIISNSKFFNCTSVQGGGGALSFENLDNIGISNCTFFGNQAKASSEQTANSGVGGTGIILCTPTTTRKCLINLENNSFISNYASNFGPLFITNTLIEKNIILLNLNNKDGLAFSNSSGNFPPKAFIVLPEHEALENESVDIESNNRKFDYDLETIKSKIIVKSGNVFKLEIKLTDSKGQVLVFDNKSTCSIENPLFTNKQTTINKGFMIAAKGIFIFSELSFRNIPDSVANLSVVIKIPIDLILNPEPIILSYSIRISFSPCVRGEIIQSDLSCLKCAEGKFSIIDPMIGFDPEQVSSNPQKCELCSDKAVCPGGESDFPRATYWRSIVNTSKFWDCFIPEACEGPGNFTLSDRLGKCAEGHYGNLCNDCIHGYGKLNANFQCEPCEITNRGAIVRLIFASIFLFTYAIAGSYMYSIQDGDIKKHGYLFVYVKISLNFTQVITLLTFMKFTWVLPSLKKFFSTSSNSVSFATEDVLLNDCMVEANISDINNIYAMKVIIVVFFPIILGVFTSLFWIAYYFILRLRLSKINKLKKLKDARKVFYIRLLASFIISIFLFHPLIIRSSFNMLNCFQINEEDLHSDSFLFVYPNFLCWSSFHYKIIIFFAIPGIVVWGFFFPALLMYVLLKQQSFKKLRTIRVTRKHESTIKLSSPAKIYEKKISNSSGQSLKDTSFSSQKIEAKLMVYNMEGDEFIPVGETPASATVIDKQASRGEGYSPTHKKSIFDAILKSNIFKFLYYGYKNEYTYWECFNFIKKLLISLLINLNQIIGYDIIVLFILLILILSFWMQYHYEPFVRDDLNFLELLSSSSIFLIFVSIVILSTNVPLSLLYIFSLLILILYIFFSVITGYYIIKTIKETNLIKQIWASFRLSSSLRKSDRSKSNIEGDKNGGSGASISNISPTQKHN